MVCAKGGARSLVGSLEQAGVVMWANRCLVRSQFFSLIFAADLESVVIELVMGPNPRLSPTTSYYIRQILTQNRFRLRFVVAPKAALEADSMADMNAVIDSLYPDTDEAIAVGKKLERLVAVHQILKRQGSMYADNVEVVEQEICWLLGFKLIDIQPSSQDNNPLFCS